MAFTEHREIVGQDILTIESMHNDDTLHMLGMYAMGDGKPFQLEAYKRADAEPYYSFNWATTITGPSAAAKVLDEAGRHPGLEATSGPFLIITDEMTEYEWAADKSAGSFDVTSLELTDVQMMHLATERATLAWEAPNVHIPTHRMAVVSDVPIGSPWIQELIDKSTDVQVRSVIATHAGVLAAWLTTFIDAPFGICSATGQQK